jgi:hypothetical protein
MYNSIAMKKIFTLLALAFISLAGSAQQVSIQIDTVWYTPSNPSAGDSIYLHVNGSANCQFAQQGPTFISDTGRLHTLSVCLLGDPNTAPTASFSLNYGVYRANTAGQDTLEYMFFYNQEDTLFCDTTLEMGMFIIQVDPAGVLTQQSPLVTASWDAYNSVFTVSRLQVKAEFQLMDMSGRMIRRQQLNGTSAEIKIDGAQNGIYMVYISDSKGGILYRDKILIAN